jgi:hypothetical protein
MMRLHDEPERGFSTQRRNFLDHVIQVNFVCPRNELWLRAVEADFFFFSYYWFYSTEVVEGVCQATPDPGRHDRARGLIEHGGLI